MIRLYLDIDGVLLTAKHTQAAPNVDEFVAFVTANFECYWLTTHCKSNSDSALNYLSHFLLPETLEKLRQSVQPTSWDTLKTEAINLNSDFYWLDDQPFQSEISYLQRNDVGNRLLIVNLNRPNELLTVQATLQQKLHVELQS
ncbi:hypothetical protein E4631_16915 [Hymenobacter sp. UV11]|uniref:hypothetical protein n=1 Tax=Hymenobacter sp. UV11 TaxID=1849735 RepID=UPI00105CE6C4|nr:hypothetical protein [Hymenobacter sp. UV11]TDN37999.1 hypothetical protein A8B98_01730 [Hymenobacter sp. UV11]TFZ65212.1 hypothetical protein E4631_16915 [Hymenobacter sp. UV11]